MEQFEREALLIGREGVERLRSKRVALFGIGGVGGYVAEALIRSGVGSLDFYDNDQVALSNLNRQLIALHSTVGRDKVDVMTERLKELGLMKGDTEEAVRAGAHAMFMPHGLGHMMGMDVHDMEGLGQTYVGFDDEVRPNLEQFGTNCLRCGRRLQEGFVMTDEPGIYFIPALIDEWRSTGHCAEFLNFDKLETYKDFGGIRIEDDILITKDGCRYLGKDRIPY